MDNLDYCRQKSAPSGSNFYYATLFYPQPLRQSLHVLHAFTTEIDNVIIECSDPGVARIKLQWWHEETQRIFSGQARHPVSKAFFNQLTDQSLAEKLHQIIIFTERKLTAQQPDNFIELIEQLYQGPGLTWQLTAELCKYTDEKTPRLITETGCLISIFELIQNTRFDVQNGRLFLPKEDMDKMDIKNIDLVGTDNDKTRNFYAYQLQRLKNRLENLDKEISVKDRYSQLACLIMNRLVVKTCKEIAADNFNLQKHRVSLTPIRKLWIAWYTKIRN